MSQAKTAKEVLIAVEWILTNVGWSQGAYYRDKNGDARVNYSDEVLDGNLGSMCLHGAVALVDSPYSAKAAARTRLRKAVGYSAIAFNDDEGRTKEEVIAMIHKAIEDKS